MLEPAHRAPADLHALPDRIVDGAISNDNVAALAETGNDTADGGEGLRVNDACGNTQVCGNISLGLHVDVLGAVETRRATGADAVGAQGLYGFLLKHIG